MIFAFGHLLPGGVCAQNYANSSANNEILLSGSSPFEDLTEFAISADREGIKRALQTYDAQAKKVENALPVMYRDKLKALVAGIRQAEHQGNYDVIALKSPEAYPTLINALDRRSLKVPVEVSLLDYVGFRFLAVLHVKPTDWSDLQAAAKYAQKNWDAIKSRVTDTGLREAIDITMTGLIKSYAVKNADMALFAAQVDHFRSVL
jgi:predicted RNA-binding Zn ribbon-like protein